MRYFLKFSSAIILSLLIASCGKMEQLEQMGQAPPLKEVDNPLEEPNYRPVTWPLPENNPPRQQYAGSLWQQGSRHFFRDQRASRVGDIVRVRIEIQDRAELGNETSRQRNSSENLSAPQLLGLESALYGILPGNQDPNNLITLNGNNTTEGSGEVAREEVIQTQVAAIVTQRLPNGNMVIKGSQEIRVNFEVREVSVAGVIRPEDIDSDNTIDSTQIAQARISYGGRGQITDVQQPRWGNQVIDIISPF